MADFIPTRASMVKQKLAANYVSAKYEAPKKKKKKASTNEENPKPEEAPTDSVSTDGRSKPVDPKKQQELEMKRARFEVMKFGMTGFEKVKAEEAKIALAIKLGAKPPKNKGKNYKELKLERSKTKEREKKSEHVSGLGGSLSKRKITRKGGKKESGILGVYGKVQKNTSRRK